MTTATHTDTANWLSDAHVAIKAVEALYGDALASVRARVTKDGKLSAELIEADQHAAHGLSWLATYKQGLSELLHYAERLSAEGAYGETEQLLTRIGFAEFLAQVFGGIPMSQ
ncbi:MAG: acyl-CoA dehydrogenase, partial [Methylocystis sp.]